MDDRTRDHTRRARWNRGSMRPGSTFIDDDENEDLFAPEGFLEEDPSLCHFQSGEDTKPRDEEAGGKEEDQEIEDLDLDDHSMAEESFSSMDSSEAREAAIREGFLGFLCGYLQNDIFQRFLELVMPWISKFVNCIKRLFGRQSDDDGEAEEIMDLAADVVDMDDLAGSALRISSQAQKVTEVQRVGQTGTRIGQSAQKAKKIADAGRMASNMKRASDAQRAIQAASRIGQVNQAMGSAGTLQSSQASTMAAMANSAAQGAATATATATTTATTAGATTAAVSATGIISTVSGAVASTGVATQVGVAVGVAAATAAAVSSGVVISPRSVSFNSTEPPATELVLPNCTDGQESPREGFVELHIEGMPQDAIPFIKEDLQDLFQTIYNNMTGMCLDPFHRILFDATLEDWNTTVKNNGTMEDTTKTFWTAKVSCSGCSDIEPLFDLPGSEVTTETLPTQSQNLHFSEFFPLFASAFGFNAEAILVATNLTTEGGNSMTRVVRAISKTIATIPNQTAEQLVIVEDVNRPTIQRYDDLVAEASGQLIAPFIAEELSYIEACIVLDEGTVHINEDDPVCEYLAAYDLEQLAQCIKFPTSAECQVLLDDAVESLRQGIDKVDHQDTDPSSNVVLPNCTDVEASIREGFLELYLEGIPDDVLPAIKENIEELFKTIYNNMTGMCLDPFHRILFSPTMVDWQVATTTNSATMEDVTTTQMHWTGQVSCSQCFDAEPLFGGRTEEAEAVRGKASRHRSVLESGLSRNLHFSEFFPLFASSFGFNVEALLVAYNIISDGRASTTRVVRAITRSKAGFENEITAEFAIVEEIGRQSIEPYDVLIAEAGGQLTAPFVAEELSYIGDCIVLDERTIHLNEDDPVCDHLAAYDLEQLAQCVEIPTSAECQVLLEDALDSVQKGMDKVEATSNQSSLSAAAPSTPGPTSNFIAFSSQDTLQQSPAEQAMTPTSAPSTSGHTHWAPSQVPSGSPSHVFEVTISPQTMAGLYEFSSEEAGQLQNQPPMTATPTTRATLSPFSTNVLSLYTNTERQQSLPTTAPDTPLPTASPPTSEPTPELPRTDILTSRPPTSAAPTPVPSRTPTPKPSQELTLAPTLEPPTMNALSSQASATKFSPTVKPTQQPTPGPATNMPTTGSPTSQQPTSNSPTTPPSSAPTPRPSQDPTSGPTLKPSPSPSSGSTRELTPEPTREPTPDPTREPTPDPTPDPTREPTSDPTREPTPYPTPGPTIRPTTASPTTAAPTTANPTQEFCPDDFTIYERMYYVTFDEGFTRPQDDGVALAFVSAYNAIDQGVCDPILLGVEVDKWHEQRRGLQIVNPQIGLLVRTEQTEPGSIIESPSVLKAILDGINAAVGGSGAVAIEISNTLSTRFPSSVPSEQPSIHPSEIPSSSPSLNPSRSPSALSSKDPSSLPSAWPSRSPSSAFSTNPSNLPSDSSSGLPSLGPSYFPSRNPSGFPSISPSVLGSSVPSANPSRNPSGTSSSTPSFAPSNLPSDSSSGLLSLGPSYFPSRNPSGFPSISPSVRGSSVPSRNPSGTPSSTPSFAPSGKPSHLPSANPSRSPTGLSSSTPSKLPSALPSSTPSDPPSLAPSDVPSLAPPANHPSELPSTSPSTRPSDAPSLDPSVNPSHIPSELPSFAPSNVPSLSPSRVPSFAPSVGPSDLPSLTHSDAPSLAPSVGPSYLPSELPSTAPSDVPSITPSDAPSSSPSISPSNFPSATPSISPSDAPSSSPSIGPSVNPSKLPSISPSDGPSLLPSDSPSTRPSEQPSTIPSKGPSTIPSEVPSELPSISPSDGPSLLPSDSPSTRPSDQPSTIPSKVPSDQPSNVPSKVPSGSPSLLPSEAPSTLPSLSPSAMPSATPYPCFPDISTLTSAIAADYTNTGTFPYTTYGPISGWCFAPTITDFSFLFSSETLSENIDAWDVSNVLNMIGMFEFSTYSSAGTLGAWDVSSVTDMDGMFYSSDFNQDISSWVTSNVENMRVMFSGASSFNQDIGGWDVAKVTSFGNMFGSASAFNQDLGSWNVAASTTFKSMFSQATNFDQDLKTWDVSLGTDFSYMFANSGMSFSLCDWGVHMGAATDVTNMFFPSACLASEAPDLGASPITPLCASCP